MAGSVRTLTKRDIVGRTIVAVSFGEVDASSGQLERTIGTIVLDNGRQIWFRTIETESGSEYGVKALTMTRGGVK